MFKRAFIFSINDDYSFLLATLLLGLREYSPEVFNASDYFVYTEDVSEENRNNIRKIIPHVIFKHMDEYTNIPNEVYQHRLVTTKRWGKYVLRKIGCFDLLQDYDQLVFLDVDMLVQGDISEALNMKGDILWTPCPVDLYKRFKPPKQVKKFPTCHGGTVIINKSFLKYGIDEDKIRNVMKNCGFMTYGGIEEIILEYLVIDNDMDIGVLPITYNNYTLKNTEESIILHFSGDTMAPWKDGLCYHMFPDWKKFYKIWRELGGSGPDFNQSAENLFNQGYCYRFANYSLRFIEIMRDLDILKNDMLFTQFTSAAYYCIIYIRSIPDEIHYELLIDGKYIKVGLHCESDLYMTEEMTRIFKEIYKNLSEIISNVTWKESARNYKIDSWTDKEGVNSTVNLFVKYSLDKLIKHWHG